MPIDLSDAIFTVLRQNSAVTTAFGDTWNPVTQTGVCKFFGDYAAQVPEPQLIEFEPGETYQFMSRAPNLGATSYYADGQIQLAILAPDRSQARQLGELVILALFDQLVSWPGTNEMLLRPLSAAFVPQRTVGPGIPAIFQRVLTFQYEYSGAMPGPIS